MFETATLLIKGFPAAWQHGGSKLLFAIAVACVTAFVVLFVANRNQIPLASIWWQSYGLALLLAGAVFLALACFKIFFELQDKVLVMIADGRISMWDHAKQPNGIFITHFHLQLEATNTKRKALSLSHAKLIRPWVWKTRVLDERVSTEFPALGQYGDHDIPGGTCRRCIVDITVKGIVGGEHRKKPMQVIISVQDNFNRWHKVKFRDLYSPALNSARWS
jgi:hypothetical protein